MTEELQRVSVALLLVGGCSVSGVVGSSSATLGATSSATSSAASSVASSAASTTSGSASSSASASSSSASGSSTSSSSAGTTSTGTSGTSGGATTGTISGSSSTGTGSTGNSSGSGSGGTAVAGSDEVLPGIYGMPFTADSLQNWTVGGASSNDQVSYRFRAPRSGTLDHVVTFFIFNSTHGGYALGTGGTVQLTLYPDDGTAAHHPDTTQPMSQVTAAPFALDGGYTSASQDRDALAFQTLTWPGAPAVVGGDLYHVVFSNLDPTPEQNYVSVDGLTWFGQQAPAPGRASTTDWGLLINSGSGWLEWSLGEGDLETPVLSLAYTDQTSFGCGYMEVWPDDNGIQVHTIDGNGDGVRERFTPTQDMTFTSVSVRAQNTGAAGALLLTLEQDQGATVEGTEIAQATVLASAFVDGGYVTGTFPSPVQVSAGTTYDLALSASGGGTFSAFCLRDGSEFGFDPGSVFGDGYAQYNVGTGWEYWYGWASDDNPSYVYGDLQLYFQTR